MKYGIGYLRETAFDALDEAAMADRLGYDLFGVPDSQALGHELYASLGPLARETDRIALGPTITNPITRHPVVTASAMATVDDLADGRAVMGVGSGDSSVYTLGKRPATLAELEATITDVKSLWRGEQINVDGTDVGIEWIDPDEPRDIPVLLAAEGPKTLRLAGRIADGVIVGLGVSPEVRETAVSAIEAGARAAGRDPDDIENWYFVQANIADDAATALDEIRGALAGVAHHSLQFSLEGKAVPERYREPVRELVERYDSAAHQQDGTGSNEDLVGELGLTDYLADRYAVAGTRDQVAARLSDLEQAGNVDGLLLTEHTDEPPSVLSWIGEELL
jgi:5,10-methylenetetrahydromethanopterin reductase